MVEKKILDAIWFHEMGSFKPIGIVKIDNGFEIKYYIGTCNGENEETDRINIMERGAKFPAEAAEKLFM